MRAENCSQQVKVRSLPHSSSSLGCVYTVVVSGLACLANLCASREDPMPVTCQRRAEPTRPGRHAWQGQRKLGA